MKKIRPPVIFISIILLIVLAFIYFALDLPSRSKAVPLLVGAITIGLVVLQILLETVPTLSKRVNVKVDLFSEKIENAKKKLEKEQKRPIDQNEDKVKRFLDIWIWIAVLAIGVFLIGYLVALPIFIFLFYLIRGDCKWPIALGITSIFWIAIYFTFEVVLHAGLYKGIITTFITN